MGIGDDELDTSQAPARQLAQELRPDRLGLGCADLQAKHFTASIGVDADGDDGRDRDDATAAPDLEIGGIDPEIWPFALDGSVEEGFDLVVDLLASRETWLLEMPLMPMALTRSSTERVEMPWI